jgi:gas vesicle protein
MISVKQTFKLYDILNRHFNNEEDSRIFVSEIEDIMDNKVDLKMNDFAMRKDLAELGGKVKQDLIELHSEFKQDMAELRSEFKQDMAELRSEFKHDMAELRSELKQDMTELRSELKQDISRLRSEVKEDISELRSDFHKLDASLNLNLANSAIILERTQKEQLKWLIGAMVAIMSLAVAIIKFT